MKTSSIVSVIMLSLFHINCLSQGAAEAHQHKNEVSIATGIVPLVAEDEITAGIHLHYTRGVTKSNRLGLGFSFETILDEHKHYTSSAVFQYRLIKGWSASYSPGLLIRKEDANYEYQFASHIETTYEFEFGDFHFGPVAELGIEKNSIHYMGGIHLGIGFKHKLKNYA